MAQNTLTQQISTGVAGPGYQGSTVTNTANPDGKYNIENYMYPANLLRTDDPAPNYVMFYINVSSDSKMLKSKEELVVQDAPKREIGELRGKEVGPGLFTGAAATGAVGGLGADMVLNTFGFVSSRLASAAIGAGVGTLAVQNVLQNTQGFTRPTKRLKTAIALHVPNNLAINYSVNYKQDNLGFLGTAAAIAASNPELANKIQNLNPGAINTSDLVNLFKSASPALASATVRNSPALSFFSGLASNPRFEQLFNSVNFRQFQFDYQFAPRNSKEAQNVLNIIHQFKYHMHPEFLENTANFLYLYPSEFDIVYYTGANENKKLHKHEACVLTDMNVNYTPNGQFTTFMDGMPTQINVTLSFLEIALLNKDKIAQNEGVTEDAVV